MFNINKGDDKIDSLLYLYNKEPIPLNLNLFILEFTLDIIREQ